MLKVTTLTKNFFYVDGKRVSSEQYHLVNHKYSNHFCFLTKQIPNKPDHYRHWHSAHLPLTPKPKGPPMTPPKPQPLASLHEELRILLQKFADDHQLKVTNADIDWFTTYNQEKQAFIVHALSVTVESISP